MIKRLFYERFSYIKIRAGQVILLILSFMPFITLLTLFKELEKDSIVAP